MTSRRAIPLKPLEVGTGWHTILDGSNTMAWVIWAASGSQPTSEEWYQYTGSSGSVQADGVYGFKTAAAQSTNQLTWSYDQSTPTLPSNYKKTGYTGSTISPLTKPSLTSSVSYFFTITDKTSGKMVALIGQDVNTDYPGTIVWWVQTGWTVPDSSSSWTCVIASVTTSQADTDYSALLTAWGSNMSQFSY